MRARRHQSCNAWNSNSLPSDALYVENTRNWYKSNRRENFVLRVRRRGKTQSFIINRPGGAPIPSLPSIQSTQTLVCLWYHAVLVVVTRRSRSDGRYGSAKQQKAAVEEKGYYHGGKGRSTPDGRPFVTRILAKSPDKTNLLRGGMS